MISGSVELALDQVHGAESRGVIRFAQRARGSGVRGARASNACRAMRKCDGGVPAPAVRRRMIDFHGLWSKVEQVFASFGEFSGLPAHLSVTFKFELYAGRSYVSEVHFC